MNRGQGINSECFPGYPVTFSYYQIMSYYNTPSSNSSDSCSNKTFI